MHNCANCRVRAYAERKPRSILGRIWRWHAGWCPAWKRYQRKLVETTSPPMDAQAAPRKPPADHPDV